MGTTDKDEVLEKLDNVIDPCSAAKGLDLSIVDMGLVDEIEIDESAVDVSMLLTSPTCEMLWHFIDSIEEEVTELDGITDVSVDFDDGLEWRPKMMTDEALAEKKRYRKELEERYKGELINS